MKDRVLLAQGNGGVENSELIKVFLKHFDNTYGSEDAGLFGESFLESSAESALKSSAKIGESSESSGTSPESNAKKYATSIDSFTITPIFFSGGDIGKLSICGSANDVAVMGAKPKYLSASFIIEEGFKIADLEKIAHSMAVEMKNAGIALISADTKVIERRDSNAPSGIFITTAIIGEVLASGISAKNLRKGDSIIVSGNVGTHGACIYCEREGINLEHSLQSDCANLWGLVELLIKSDIKIHAIRDATRGGIASTLNEWARASNCAIEISEGAIPISAEVRGVCEILGIDALSLANEGVCVIAVPSECANKVVALLKSHELGKNAQIIGFVDSENAENRVVLKSDLGIKRYLEYPQGEILPRIC